MENTYLRLDNLSVGFGKKEVVSDIELEIKKGEIFTLIGPNGAGKSTILKTITRKLKPLKGIIYIENDNFTQIRSTDLARKMSVVLTEHIKPELMTCREVVALGRYPYTNFFGRLTSEDEQKVDEALGLVNAKELSGALFDMISDGQRQRVLLAKAICQEPEIIVLDEPTSFLDIKHKAELLLLLKKLSHENGTTIFMSLHEIELASIVSDRIACVRDGKIVNVGTPGDILTKECITRVYDITDEIYEMLYSYR